MLSFQFLSVTISFLQEQLPKIDSGWVQHLKSPAKKAVAPRIRVEVERVDANGYTVFEEQWIDDPKVSFFFVEEEKNVLCSHFPLKWVAPTAEELEAQIVKREEKEEEPKSKAKPKAKEQKKKKKGEDDDDEVAAAAEKPKKQKTAKKKGKAAEEDVKDEVVLADEPVEEPPKPKKPAGILNFFSKAPKK